MSDLLNKEEKEEMVQRRMEEMKRKNEAIRKRQEEIAEEKRMLGDAAAAPKLVLSKDKVTVPEFKDEWGSRDEEQYETRLSGGGNAWPGHQSSQSQHRQPREQKNNLQTRNYRHQNEETEETWGEDSNEASPYKGGIQPSPTAPHQSNNRTKYTNRAGPGSAPVGSAPAGRGRGRGKAPPTESYDETRKANALAYEQEMKQQQTSNFLSDPRREGQTENHTTNQDRRAHQTQNQTQRHPRNFGGGDLREKIKQQRHNNPVSGPLEVTMTGKERDHYQKWKKDRDVIDQERVERAKKNTGEWKREWDVPKVNKAELPPQMSLYEQMDERKHSPQKPQTSEQMKGVYTGKGSVPGGGRGRGRGNKPQNLAARHSKGGDDRSVQETGDDMKITIPNKATHQSPNQTGPKSPRRQSARSPRKPPNQFQNSKADQQPTTPINKKYNQAGTSPGNNKYNQDRTNPGNNKYNQEKATPNNYSQEKTTPKTDEYNQERTTPKSHRQKQERTTPNRPATTENQKSPARSTHKFTDNYKGEKAELAPYNTNKPTPRTYAPAYRQPHKKLAKPKQKQVDEEDEWQTDEEGWVTDGEEEVGDDAEESTELKKTESITTMKSNTGETEKLEHTEPTKHQTSDSAVSFGKVEPQIEPVEKPENSDLVSDGITDVTPGDEAEPEKSATTDIAHKAEHGEDQAEEERTPICSKEGTPVPQSKESTPVPEGLVKPQMSKKAHNAESGISEAHHLHIDIRDPVEEEDDRPEYLRTPEGGWSNDWSEMAD